MEIKHLYGNGKDSSKEYCEPKNYSCNYAQKFMFEVKDISQVLFNCLTVAAILKGVLYISKLWNNQSIEGPRYWTYPIVPSPPHRNTLYIEQVWKSGKKVNPHQDMCRVYAKDTKSFEKEKIMRKQHLQVVGWWILKKDSIVHRKLRKLSLQCGGLVWQPQPSCHKR